MQFNPFPLIYKRAPSMDSSNSFANNSTQSIKAFPSASVSAVARKTTTTKASRTSSLPYVYFSRLSTDAVRISNKTKGISPTAGAAASAPWPSTSSSVDPSSKSMSGGSIAGTVIGVVAAVAVIVAIVLFTLKRRRRQREKTASARGAPEMFHAYSSAAPVPSSNNNNNLPVASQQRQELEDVWQGEPPLGVHMVTATYSPNLDDEIYVVPGDEVHIFTEYDDGWCLGLNVTRGRARGVFPKYCIRPNSTSTTSSPQPQPQEGYGGNNNRNNNRDSRWSRSMLNPAAM